jgi:hypothetical protein
MATENKENAASIKDNTPDIESAVNVLPVSMSFPDREHSNRSMEQIIQQYPAAKTNLLQSYES